MYRISTTTTRYRKGKNLNEWTSLVYILTIFVTSCIIFRSSISTLNREAARASKKLTEANKLLRKVREDLNLQITNLINLTSLLQRGDDELQNDFVTIRRHELNSQLVREAIIAGAGFYSIIISILSQEHEGQSRHTYHLHMKLDISNLSVLPIYFYF